MICSYCQSVLIFSGEANGQVEFYCSECFNRVWLDAIEYAIWQSPYEQWQRSLVDEIECYNPHCNGGPQTLDLVGEDDVEWMATYTCADCGAETNVRVSVEGTD